MTERRKGAGISRRQFVGGVASVSAVSMLGGRPGWAEAPATLAQRGSGRCVPFPLHAVRLSAGGLLTAQAATNEHYLETLETDRLLHSFRLTAGITSTAKPYGGWEEPACELRGHFAGGHYLSAVAFAAASTGNDELRRRGDTVVAGLAACQKRNGAGYVGAYPAAFFERLARGESIWAPFYTLHKILAGLLDMYVQTGNEDALKVAEGVANWTGGYFAGMSDDQRQRMLRVEYGGMNEALVNLAQLTGRERYLGTARLFEQPMLLDALAHRRDELQGLHANTTVPKIIGAARTYEVTGERRYREIAEYFLDEVLRERSYAIGNTSVDEHWKYPAGEMKGTLSLYDAECCVAYNLMKLERLVFGWTGDARWMDAHERTLWNARLGTQNAEGLKQYFFPLAAGFYRAYGSAEESFWCCTGTGAEEFAKFNDTIYFLGDEDVYVNQFVASELQWKEKGFGLRQATNFPHEQGTTLTVVVERPQERTVLVRVPAWTADGGSVRVNGQLLEAFAQPGTYLAVRRTWKNGDRVELKLPMRVTEEPLPGDAGTLAALYGPLVLAKTMGDGPKDGPTKIIHGRATAPKIDEKPGPLPRFAGVSVPSAERLQFRAEGGGEVLPMYQVGDQRYAAYWGRAKA